jgi:hypothetical protein
MPRVHSGRCGSICVMVYTMAFLVGTLTRVKQPGGNELATVTQSERHSAGLDAVDLVAKCGRTPSANRWIELMTVSCAMPGICIPSKK